MDKAGELQRMCHVSVSAGAPATHNLRVQGLATPEFSGAKSVIKAPLMLQQWPPPAERENHLALQALGGRRPRGA
jgi:hypothetical protein